MIGGGTGGAATGGGGGGAAAEGAGTGFPAGGASSLKSLKAATSPSFSTIMQTSLPEIQIKYFENVHVFYRIV